MVDSSLNSVSSGQERSPIRTVEIPEEIVSELILAEKQLKDANFQIVCGDKSTDDQAKIKALFEAEKKINLIYDRLTVGLFLDDHNANQVIYGSVDRFGSDTKVRGTFNVDDRLSQDMLNGGFFFSVHGSRYLSSDSIVVIFSPSNRMLSKFLRASCDAERTSEDGFSGDFLYEHFLKKLPLSQGRNNIFEGRIILKDMGVVHPRYPRWSDISKCIVDIRSRKVYFYEN